jgi:hypothetical protein
MELQILLRIGQCSYYYMENCRSDIHTSLFRAALFVYKNINAQNVKSVLDTLKLVGLVLPEKIGCTLS